MKSLTADPSRARYLCQLHLVAGVMTLDALKRNEEFYTLTGKSAEMDTSGGVRAGLLLPSDRPDRPHTSNLSGLRRTLRLRSVSTAAGRRL